ncbi:MAG: hypothetical protein CK527_04345 [Nitrosarchaeum sp.]|nr:MAG: hypothetical protein CK527_04345 [Nitrosarchaeum sp.]
MNDEIEKVKEIISENSDVLAKLGKELSAIHFSYKITENSTELFWQNRINEFKKYYEKGKEYYIQAHELMNLKNKEQAGLFLLRISKFSQMALKFIANMEEVKNNPSVIKLKDKQQSKWSKELRERLVESNNACFQYETDMNKFFREFYETSLKDIKKQD